MAESLSLYNVVENRALFLASASLIGTMLIGIIGGEMKLSFTDLDDLDSRMLNQVVHIRGVIKESKESDYGYKLLLEQDGFKVSVTYFTKEDLTSKKGMCADVVGEVKTYRGSVEIDAKGLKTFFC